MGLGLAGEGKGLFPSTLDSSAALGAGGIASPGKGEGGGEVGACDVKKGSSVGVMACVSVQL